MFNFQVLVLGLSCLAAFTNAGIIHEPVAVAAGPVAVSSQSIHQVHGPSYRTIYAPAAPAVAYAAAPVAAPVVAAGYHAAPALAYSAGIAPGAALAYAAPGAYPYAAHAAPLGYAVDPYVAKLHLK
ncbi:hypothetical protein QAD02_015094 [Eretmocerus hayati]|uniref:Uncharacterized protein n=1 Tax=Eretmocerus hayati TaxID=131215 RepID=A0ACC2P7A0_9HYME|nr:hypothetical protein QAD02_015094 [Eretmocerus hayati]